MIGERSTGRNVLANFRGHHRGDSWEEKDPFEEDFRNLDDEDEEEDEDLDEDDEDEDDGDEEEEGIEDNEEEDEDENDF